jgi:4'-phosphopantetheinyl transferase
MADQLRVDIWTLAVENEVGNLLIQASGHSLPADELSRCLGLHRQQDQQTALLSRMLVRTVLALRGNVAPARLQFHEAANGKPVTATPGGDLHFSLTHSQQRVSVAVSSAPIGLDMEFRDNRRDLQRLAKRFYSRQESDYLVHLAPADARIHFYNLWVLKEACTKALATTLPWGLERFFFQPDNNGYNMSPAPGIDPVHWQFSNLELAPAFSAALACRNGDCALSIRNRHLLPEQVKILWQR